MIKLRGGWRIKYMNLRLKIGVPKNSPKPHKDGINEWRLLGRRVRVDSKLMSMGESSNGLPLIGGNYDRFR